MPDKRFQVGEHVWWVGQEIWWWDEVHLELHKGKLYNLYGNWIPDSRWQVETTDDCDSDGRPFHITVPVSNVYVTLEEARLKITKMLYRKAKAAVREAEKYDQAHLKLLRL